MELLTTPLLFLDCQTTGMRPSVGHLLEMAWGWGKASDENLDSLHSDLVQLPEGETIPSAVTAITGIENSHLLQAGNLENLFQHFQKTFEKENQSSKAVIHYAQFERPFLEDLFFRMNGTKDLPFEIFCSQALARKIFPTLPSRNIRGLSGYLGTTLGELRRASSHVQATFLIWKGLVQELNRQGVFSFEDLEVWLKQPKTANKIRYEYRIEKDKRLNLPARPGIYRMKAKSGEILYVGKATSLKDRVNSYFRGKKGRDPRKLELMAQVWDFDFIETESVLEAALLESDEIKRLDPPYNVSLRVRDRDLLFYSHHFTSTSPHQDEIHVLGPFRPQSAIERLRLLSLSLQQNIFHPIFYEPIPSELMQKGLEIFCQEKASEALDFIEVRSSLALGMKLLRQKIKNEKNTMDEVENESIETEIETDERTELTAADVSQKFERLFLRAAMELRRARQMTRLLNCHIEWESEVGWKSLELQNGKIQITNKEIRPKYPWENLNISDYDRMSILLSEISKHSHRIENSK